MCVKHSEIAIMVTSSLSHHTIHRFILFHLSAHHAAPICIMPRTTQRIGSSCDIEAMSINSRKSCIYKIVLVLSADGHLGPKMWKKPFPVADPSMYAIYPAKVPVEQSGSLDVVQAPQRPSLKAIIIHSCVVQAFPSCCETSH